MTPLLFFLNDENPICLAKKKKKAQSNGSFEGIMHWKQSVPFHLSQKKENILKNKRTDQIFEPLYPG